MTTKRKKVIDVFWRIYFCTYIIILILGVFSIVLDENTWTCSLQIKIMDGIFCIIDIIGLFAYTYGKNIFKPVFWKTYFFILLIWHFYLNIFVMPVSTPGNTTILECIMIDLLIHAPLYLAVYLYAFKFKR